MKSFIKRARKIHRSEKGFTLIELLVVMAILAVLVGLVVPNFFGMAYEAEATMIAGQHEKLREAVFMYYIDTGQFPTEWSAYVAATRQLSVAGGIPGWRGPYIERPIGELNRWGGHWGVYENRKLTGAPGDPHDFTVLLYTNVPREVCEILDEMIDDGARTTGIVRYYEDGWGVTDAAIPDDDRYFLSIMIARQP
ncbi:MAG: Type II secretion system protein G [Dehalococcoidia bacterium]|nr:Type II secretion system protein G [Chloroflexota bacterium]